tara:strand:+ start:547 stop:747 length:201 start_codon:yes stop_codon:yes gene_type:complete
MYDDGKGIPQNDAEVVKWYLKATNQGYAGAQSNLFYMYSHGKVIPENYIKAYSWFSVAKTKVMQSC